MGRQNQLLWSRDFSQSPWEQADAVVLNDGIGLNGALSAAKISEATATENFYIQDVTTPIAINDIINHGVLLNLTGANEGDGRVDLRIEQDGAGTAEGTTVQVTLTSTLTEYPVSHTFANVQTGYRIRLINVAGGADEVHVDAPHANPGATLDAYIETTGTQHNRYFEETFQGNLGPGNAYDNAGWVVFGSPDPNALTSDVNNPPNWREMSLHVGGTTTSDDIRIFSNNTLTQYGRVEFVIQDFDMTATNQVTFVQVRDIASIRLLRIVLTAAGVLRAVFDLTTTGTENVNLGLLNVGQRYRIDWLYDISNNIYGVWLNGNNIQNGLLAGTATNIQQVWIIGGHVNNRSSLYINLLALDSAAQIHNETADVGPDGTGPTGRARGINERTRHIGDAAEWEVDYDVDQMGVYESTLPVSTLAANYTPVLEVRGELPIDEGSGVTFNGAATDKHRPIIIRPLHGHSPQITSEQ